MLSLVIDMLIMKVWSHLPIDMWTRR